MIYMDENGKADVKKWLNSGAVIKYDFVEDTQDKRTAGKQVEESKKRDYGRIDNSYKKFLIYKFKADELDWSILNDVKNEEHKKRFLLNKEIFLEEASFYRVNDPDSASNLLQEIYKILWPSLIKNGYMRQKAAWSYMKQDDGKIAASDTMTSAMVRFSDAMKAVEMEKEPNINSIYVAAKKMYPMQRLWSENISVIVAAVMGDDFYRLIDAKYSYMRCFLDNIHTIGNYCPVPAEFNAARSEPWGIPDYWDLTLQKIYDWYKTKDNKYLRELLHIKEGKKCEESKAFNNCKKWLEWFEDEENKKEKEKGGWHNFVEILFLQDYANIDSNTGEYGEPEPFWPGHSWEHPEVSHMSEEDKIKCPKEQIEIINERLQKMSCRIIARSVRIVNALRKRIIESSINS